MLRLMLPSAVLAWIVFAWVPSASATIDSALGALARSIDRTRIQMAHYDRRWHCHYGAFGGRYCHGGAPLPPCWGPLACYPLHYRVVEQVSAGPSLAPNCPDCNNPASHYPPQNCTLPL